MKQDQKKECVADNPEVHDILESALQSLWGVANELSKIKPAKSERYRVSIFGSARIKQGEHLYDDAKKLACELTKIGCDIVTGGGPGLMEAANEGAKDGDTNNESRTIGIRVALPFEQNANPFVEDLYTHQTFFTRLHQFVRLSNAFIILNGGIGTTLETLMVWQLLQVKHIENVPLIFVGPMWRELVTWSQTYMLQHDPPLANEKDLQIPICVNTVEEAIEALTPFIQDFQN